MSSAVGGNQDESELTAPLVDPEFYAGDPSPSTPGSGPRPRWPATHPRVLGRQPPRRGGRHVPGPRDLLLGQGHHDHGDRGRVPHAADHDAHRPARPHPLPQAGAARLPAHVHAGPRGRDPGPDPRPGRPDRGRGRRSTSSPSWPSPCPSRSSATCWACPRRSGPASSGGPRRSSPGPPTGPRRSEPPSAARWSPTCWPRRPTAGPTPGTTSSPSWAPPRSTGTG